MYVYPRIKTQLAPWSILRSWDKIMGLGVLNLKEIIVSEKSFSINKKHTVYILTVIILIFGMCFFIKPV